MAVVYTSTKNKMLGGWDLTGGAMTAFLVSSSYSPSAAHTVLSDVPVGARLSSTTVGSRSASAGKLTGATSTFTAASGGTAVGVVLAIGNDLVGFQNMFDGAPMSIPLSGYDVIVNWGSDGILNLN